MNLRVVDLLLGERRVSGELVDGDIKNVRDAGGEGTLLRSVVRVRIRVRVGVGVGVRVGVKVRVGLGAGVRVRGRGLEG